MLDRRLFQKNLSLAPAQPATAFWRAIEVGHILASGVLPREGRGLDLGCGDGRITALLQRETNANWDLVGIDPDPNEVALARELRLYAEAQEAEGASMPFDPASFDFVFSNSVLEHIQALDATLHEVGRVLRPGSAFIFTVPSEFFPRNLGKPGLLGWLATGSRARSNYLREIDVRVAHRRYLSVDEWAAALRPVGFELVKSSYYMSPAETRRWAAISNGTAGVLVRLTRKRQSPIEIQRRIGLRQGTPPVWLRALGRTIGTLATLLPVRGETDAGRGSCVLVVARKTAP